MKILESKFVRGFIKDGRRRLSAGTGMRETAET